MSTPTIKEIDIVNEQGTPTVRNIGAEAEYIDISKDTSGNIIHKTDNAIIEPLNDFLQKINILGAKNLIKCNLPTTTNYNVKNFQGVINNDFSVTLNTLEGEFSTKGGSFLIDSNNQPIFETFLSAGEYKFSGCPSEGSDNTYYLYVYTENNDIISDKDYGNGISFVLDEAKKVYIGSYCAPDYSFINTIFKPMITVINEINTYTAYREPSMSNKQLTREINNFTINGIVPISKGGTGTKDGTINGVKLMKLNNQYGYIDIDGTFHSFRQPTGNAQAAQVLSGYTFANESSDSISGAMINYSDNNRVTVTPTGGTGNEQLPLSAGYHNSVVVNRTAPYNTGYAAAETIRQNDLNTIYNGVVNNGVTPTAKTATAIVTGINNIRSGGNAAAADILIGKNAYVGKALVSGSMANYSGSNRRTVTPTGGSGNEQLALSAGYHNSVIVNRTAPYNAGKAAAEAITWSETIQSMAMYTGEKSTEPPARVFLNLPIKNVIKIKNISDAPISLQITTSSGTTTSTLANNAEYTIRTGVTRLTAIRDVNLPLVYSAVGIAVIVYFQAKILR